MRIPAGLAKHSLALKEHAPTGLFVGGVVGMVGSTVLACRGTLKLSETLTRTQHDLDHAKGIPDEEYAESGESRQKDIALIYAKGLTDVAQLYAPSVVLGIASIAMLTKSHNILQQRNAALTAAYVALERGYAEYRERVIERYGEDVDHELRFPREKVRETNPDTGRERTVEVIGPNLDASPYARWFDESSSSWNREPEYNLLFLRNQQQWFNDKLRMQGYVFLNDVYDALGIPRSSSGQFVGWTLDGEGDGFVDFNIFNDDESIKRKFVNGKENHILLDFNVDGPIYGKIDEMHKVVWG